MARRFSAGAFVLFACVLLAPMAAEARSGGFSAAPAAGGGFRGLPAAPRHAAPRASFGHRLGPRVNVGRFDIRRHHVGRPGIHRDRFHRVGRRTHGGGYVYGTYPVDAFSYGSTVAYPYPVDTVAPNGGDPLDTTGAIGGPLLLRHVCQSEVQIVPATRGGDHEVTVTRCRLFAQSPGQ